MSRALIWVGPVLTSCITKHPNYSSKNGSSHFLCLPILGDDWAHLSSSYYGLLEMVVNGVSHSVSSKTSLPT